MPVRAPLRRLRFLLCSREGLLAEAISSNPGQRSLRFSEHDGSLCIVKSVLC